MNSTIGGTVDSPTPTTGMSDDSINSISTSFKCLDIYAAVDQPALPPPTISIFLTIQRSHDFNTTGWMSLVLLIPIVSLIFYFIPGTKGANKYGLQPPPNGKAMTIAAILLATIFVLGILAAIALPAYQDYMVRAAASAG